MDISILPCLGMRTPVSTLTHLVACVLSLFLTVRLLRGARGKPWRQLALLCFGLSATTLYGASATYHALELPAAQLLFFRLLDHSAVYLLIAGTYTPVVAVVLPKSTFRDALLAAVWGLAFAGIAAKWLIVFGSNWLTVTPYIVLGWIGAVAFSRIVKIVGIWGVIWILLGGASYTLGAVLDANNWPVLVPRIFGSHELFHVLTMLGTLFHFIFIDRYVVRYVAKPVVFAPSSGPLALEPAA
jgi:hemolysin III